MSFVWVKLIIFSGVTNIFILLPIKYLFIHLLHLLKYFFQGGSNTAAVKKVQDNFWAAFKMSLRFWTIIQYVNFTYVPIEVRKNNSIFVDLPTIFSLKIFQISLSCLEFDHHNSLFTVKFTVTIPNCIFGLHPESCFQNLQYPIVDPR